MTKWHWSFWEAVALTAAVGLVLPLLVGSVCLRVGGIAFAMVTLAFAQAGSVLAFKNPWQLTGGEDGFGADYTKLPEEFVGIFNTKNLYWLALGYAAFVFVVGRWAINSSPGHVWQAIRENELRSQVLGLRHLRLQADVVRARVVPRDARRDRLPGADQRREPVGDDAELHAGAARDGRDRRHRLALGRDDRRPRLHATSTTASPTSPARARSRRCRRCCARRCRSRSSSSARSSSSSSTSPRAAWRGSARIRRTPGRARGGERMRIAWESQGDGAPVLLMHGLGYTREGWGPLRELLARRYRVLSFDNRGIGESEIPPGPYTVEELAARRGAGARRGRRRARARRRREPRRLRGAGARGRPGRSASTGSCSSAPRRAAPARTRCRRGRCGSWPRRRRSQPEVALRRFVENAVAPGPPRRSSTRSTPTGRRTRRTRPAGPRRPARARPGTPATGSRASRRRRSSLAGTADAVVDNRNAQLLADAIPGARARADRRRRPPALLGAQPRSSRLCSKGSSGDPAHRRPDAPRPRAHDAAPRRDRGRRPRHGRTPSSTAARTSSPPSLEPASRVSTLTGSSAEHVAVFFACAKAGAILHPISWRLAPAEVACQLDDAEPALFLVEDEHRELADGGARARAASRRALELPGAPVARRARARRPAAPRLHLRHDRQAEGRAAHARELLLDEPLLRPRDRHLGSTTSCCRCCRSSTAAAGTCSRCSRGGRARAS